jgi:hypothetical protein
LGYSFNPNNGVLSVVTVLPTTPTNLTFSLSGDNLTLGWPSGYTGYILQAQTNSAGVSPTGWVDTAGSSGTNAVILQINPTNAPTFFRLRHP